MGTSDRGKVTGGSLVDGIKRRVGATETREGRPERAAEAPQAPRRATEARRSSLEVLDDLAAAFGLDEPDELDELAPELPPRAMPRGVRRILHPPRRPEPLAGMLGLRFDGAAWTAMPQRSFRPRGLFIVGELRTGDRLDQAIIGQNLQVLQSCEGVPAHFFSTARSYEQIAKVVAEGGELPAWCEWNIIHVGQMVRVTVRALDGSPVGPERIDLGFWGHTLP